MILGVAAGLPLVAGVATEDRHNTYVHCPYCYEIHSHGGLGPRSPRGAVDGGRYSHCRNTDDEEAHSDRVIDLQMAGVIPRLYVIKEVPGRAWIEWLPGPGVTERLVKRLEYDYAALASLRPEINAMVSAYEAERAAGGRRRVLVSGIETQPPVGKRCAVYLHYDGADVLLYVGISDGPAARGKSHASGSTWVQFAARGETIWCTDRDEAERVERRLIQTRGPLFNSQHAPDGTAQKLAAYLAGKGRYDLLVPVVTRG